LDLGAIACIQKLADAPNPLSAFLPSPAIVGFAQGLFAGLPWRRAFCEFHSNLSLPHRDLLALEGFSLD